MITSCGSSYNDHLRKYYDTTVLDNLPPCASEFSSEQRYMNKSMSHLLGRQCGIKEGSGWLQGPPYSQLPIKSLTLKCNFIFSKCNFIFSLE